MAYIDREKAIAYVEEQYRLFDNNESKQAVVEGCVEALKFTPTADVVEVKHGEWLTAYEYALKLGATDEVQLDAVKNDKWWKFCSLCEQQTRFEHNYCPNCGAKMDGGNE